MPANLFQDRDEEILGQEINGIDGAGLVIDGIQPLDTEIIQGAQGFVDVCLPAGTPGGLRVRDGDGLGDMTSRQVFLLQVQRDFVQAQTLYK